MNFEPEVKKEIRQMTIGSAICAAIVLAAFIIFDGFSLPLLFGVAVGFIIAAGNFLFTAVGISIALESGEELAAKKKLRISYIIRTVIILAVLAGAIVLDQKTGIIKWIPVATSVFYVRIVIAARSVIGFLFMKKNTGTSETESSKTDASVTDTSRTDEQDGVPAPLPEDEEEDEEDEFEKFVGHFAKGPVPGKENDKENK